MGAGVRDPSWQCLAVSETEIRIWPDSQVGGVEGQRSNSTGSVMKANEVMGWGWGSVLYRREPRALAGGGGCWAGWEEAE